MTMTRSNSPVTIEMTIKKPLALVTLPLGMYVESKKRKIHLKTNDITFRGWGNHVHRHTGRSRSVTHKCNTRRITSKFAYIILNPFEGHMLVPKAQVAWRFRGLQ